MNESFANKKSNAFPVEMDLLLTSQTLFSFCRLALSPRALINMWTLVWIEEIKDENVGHTPYNRLKREALPERGRGFIGQSF